MINCNKKIDTNTIPIFGYLFPIVREYISNQNPLKINPTAKEKRAIDIFLKASEITNCIDQVYLSIQILSGFRNKKNTDYNRHDYIVFMIENFYLRITSLYDRSLRFTNLVFQLGLPERECKDSTIIKNLHIKGTKIELSLKKINKLTDKYRQQRNIIAHSKKFRDEKLDNVEAYYYLINTEEHQDLKKYNHLYNQKTNEYVKDKKLELQKLADEIKSEILDFLYLIKQYLELSHEFE